MKDNIPGGSKYGSKGKCILQFQSEKTGQPMTIIYISNPKLWTSQGGNKIGQLLRSCVKFS